MKILLELVFLAIIIIGIAYMLNRWLQLRPSTAKEIEVQLVGGSKDGEKRTIEARKYPEVLTFEREIYDHQGLGVYIYKGSLDDPDDDLSYELSEGR